MENKVFVISNSNEGHFSKFNAVENDVIFVSQIVFDVTETFTVKKKKEFCNILSYFD